MTEAFTNQEQYFNSPADYKFLRFADCSLNVTQNGIAEITASLTSLKGADKVCVMVYLQRYDGDWTTIKRWESECRGSYCSFFENYSVNAEHEYRIEVYYRAHKGAYAEMLMSTDGAGF